MNLPAIFAFASAGVAAILFLTAPFSKRQSLPKWAFSLGMLALAAEQLLSGLALLSDNPLDTGRLQQTRFLATAFLPGIWILFAATFSRGDAWATVKKRWVLILATFAIPLGIALSSPNALVQFARVESAPADWTIVLGWAGFAIHVTLLVSMIGALVGLERTYRASVGTLRWKVKFTLYGLGVLFAVRFFTSSQVILTQDLDLAMDTVNAVALLLACLLVGRSLTRPGSFEIDLYPSQSVINNSLVVSLAGVYLLTVGVLAKVVTAFGGESAFALNTFLILLSIVVLGLMIQSDRFRQRMRQFVSRNFQRPLYDYRTVWLRVTEATSQSVRRFDICQAAVRLVSELLETKSANIWLFDSNASRFALMASTATPNGEPKRHEAGTLGAKLLEADEPFDLDQNKEEWANPLKLANPKAFKEGGNRVCVPLLGRDTLVGYMILGDRTNSLRFSQQEFDTLRCIGNHLAATLLSADLTKKLAQSKEIEAFQTMATFFVHDLKNAVSTLNLMLKNMPLHWDNPEFREDALRGIGSTSQRITQLITRLGEVRHELQISPKLISLKTLARDAIESWHRPDTIRFSERMDSDKLVRADPEKIKSVILNLLINATEALDGSGEISVVIEENNSWLQLQVNDNGPGMSKEFISDSLFRPFKTTKKNGLGIGMFQSKMVMEAHGGAIQAESHEGQGCHFTLRFPIATQPVPSKDSTIHPSV